jgi:hypothetical protein
MGLKPETVATPSQPIQRIRRSLLPTDDRKEADTVTHDIDESSALPRLVQPSVLASLPDAPPFTAEESTSPTPGGSKRKTSG